MNKCQQNHAVYLNLGGVSKALVTPFVITLFGLCGRLKSSHS